MESELLDSSSCALPEGVTRIGVVCSYVPEEIIYAAGLQPVRLIGDGRPVRHADSYLHNNLCPHVRGLFDQALDGGYADCAGVVFVNSCDAMRRLHDVWGRYGPHKFVHILDFLRIDGEDAVDYYADQLRELAEVLAGRFGTEVSDQRLRAAVREANELRQAISRMYALRAAVPPLISGSAAFPVLLGGARAPSSLVTAALSDGLDLVQPTAGQRHRGKPRLLISGSVFHHPQVIELIEGAGGIVVAEDSCVGHRHYDGEVVEDEDMFRAIARRYVERVACARMKDISRRHAYVQRLVDEFKVDGVVYHALKFCDLYQYDFPSSRQMLENRGVPVLYLEGDYTTGSYGQMKTRLQAFIELLA